MNGNLAKLEEFTDETFRSTFAEGKQPKGGSSRFP